MDRSPADKTAPKPLGRSLKSTFPRTMAFLFLGIGVALAGTTVLATSHRANRLERLALDQRRTRFLTYLERETRELGWTGLSHAAWQTAVDYVEDPYPDFVEDNFRPEILNAMEIDLVLIADAEGGIVWSGSAWGVHAGDGPLAAKAGEATDPSLFPASFGKLPPEPLFGATLHGGQPALFASYPITDDDQLIEPVGLLVLARIVTEERLERFLAGERAAISFLVGPAAAAAAAVAAAGTATRMEGRELAVYLPFNDAAGMPMGVWRVSLERVLSADARGLAIILVAAIGAAGLFVYLLVLHLVSRRVIRPIAAIRDHLDRCSEAMRVDAPLPARGADEIGELERHINALVARIALQTEALDRLAATDGLTELPNRRRLDTFMTALRERGKAEGAERRRAGEGARTAEGTERAAAPVGCVLIDVDYFKRYNDRYGHAAGDRVLRAVADALKASVRGDGDLACRYGGEEFVFVLPDAGLEGAGAVAERERLAFEELANPHAGSEVAAVVTLSAGVAAAPRDETFDPAALLKAADAALYKAKGSGRNRVHPPRSG